MDLSAAQRLATAPDPKSITGLLNRAGDPAVAKAVAQQFSAMLLQQVMQQSDGSAISVADGVGGGVVNSMFADTIAKTASSHEKLGLTDLLLRALQAKQDQANGGTATDVPGSAIAGGGTPPKTSPAASSIGGGFPLGPYWQGHGLRPLGGGGFHGLAKTNGPNAGLSIGNPVLNASFPLNAANAEAAMHGGGASNTQTRRGGNSANPAQISGFAQQLVPLLQQAAQKLGVSPKILLAQAAIETGWGRSVVGNNIFGIKAGSSWSGDTVTAATHEYEDGQMVAIRDSFRSYPSLAAAVQDFVSLVSNSSRYRAAIGSGDDVGGYARALLAGGWATDIDYARKLESVAAGPSVAAAFASSAQTAALPAAASL